MLGHLLHDDQILTTTKVGAYNRMLDLQLTVNSSDIWCRASAGENSTSLSLALSCSSICPNLFMRAELAEERGGLLGLSVTYGAADIGGENTLQKK